ncbi:hypothetical protein CGRA01v4_00995 [Colletotrichum graminicola]|nr:hypothetical protein CGRA01v4_00995 [Colletotrichum graminicola]
MRAPPIRLHSPFTSLLLYPSPRVKNAPKDKTRRIANWLDFFRPYSAEIPAAEAQKNSWQSFNRIVLGNTTSH